MVLLEILQTHGTSVQTDHQADEGHTHAAEEVFGVLQEKLSSCIRHHQQ